MRVKLVLGLLLVWAIGTTLMLWRAENRIDRTNHQLDNVARAESDCSDAMRNRVNKLEASTADLWRWFDATESRIEGEIRELRGLIK